MSRCLALAAAAVVVLTSCGSPTAPAPSDAAFTVAAGAPVCVDRPGTDDVLTPETQARRTPLGPQEPIRFARCSTTTGRVPGKGEWSIRIEERADGDIAALATALRLPDEGDDGGACPAMLTGVPELYAVDGAGRAVLVRWPQAACQRVRPEVDAALGALAWKQVATRRLQQVRSQASLDSGCEEHWKDMVAIEGARPDRTAGGGSTVSLAAPARVSACTYAIDERGETPTGSYVSGGATTVAVWRAVVLALRTSPAAPRDCTMPGQRFTVLLTDKEALYVELDGCRRVLLPDGGLRVATPALLTALAAT